MTKTMAAQVVAAIGTLYSYYIKDKNLKALAMLWEQLLSPYPDELVNKALGVCLSELTTPPTPADVINEIKSKYAPRIDEKWAKLHKTLYDVEDLVSRFDYTFVEDNGRTQGQNARQKVEDIFNGLPPDLKRYVGSKGELIRMSLLTDEELIFEKANFRKNFKPESTPSEILENYKLTANENTTLRLGTADNKLT